MSPPALPRRPPKPPATARGGWLLALLAPLLPGAQGMAQVAAPAPAQAAAYAPDTGDARLDRRLQDMNRYAALYPDSFIDEVSRYLDVPRAYVVALLGQPGWTPGDVWYACALGKVLAQPCRAVVRQRRDQAGAAWQATSTTLQATFGQRQRAALRELSEASYRRWARPLP